MSLNVVILAAGKGTRMHSNLPKVLQPLAKKPLIEYVLDTSKSLKPSAITIVTGYKSDLIKSAILDDSILWRLQGEQLGTGHAVKQAILDLASTGSAVIIISQDLDELLELTDNFMAINSGEMSQKINTQGLTVDEIGLMIGGTGAYWKRHD